jgi:hypothetical protein
MKKLFLSVIGMYLTMLAAFSQGQKVDSPYRTRKLSFEEANIVSSYYVQDGNHAAVTGGIGTEKLTDIATSFDVKFARYDKHGRKHSFTGELGIDHYTSASSDKIDPHTISSASSADNRIYPSLQWNMENTNKGKNIGAGFAFSNEFDYNSYGFNLGFAKKTRDRNGEFSAKIQAYLDQLRLIYPIELRPNGSGDDDSYGTAGRNTYSGSFSWSQIINTQLQVMLEAELVYQTGYLGLPFHRVYFNDGSVHVENLPTSRMKLPLGVRASYFLGDRFILRGWYRYYHDDWGINSNAVMIETVFKVNPFFSITPYYRFYQQTAADYFGAYMEHSGADNYYTSNYSYAKFNSHFLGAGFRIAPPKGVFHIQRVNSLELRYGHYQKTTDLNANIISMHIGFR